MVGWSEGRRERGQRDILAWEYVPSLSCPPSSPAVLPAVVCARRIGSDGFSTPLIAPVVPAVYAARGVRGAMACVRAVGNHNSPGRTPLLHHDPAPRYLNNSAGNNSSEDGWADVAIKS